MSFQFYLNACCDTTLNILQLLVPIAVFIFNTMKHTIYEDTNTKNNEDICGCTLYSNPQYIKMEEFIQ